ncbi:MAG: type II secretion system protein [Gammaproteobacteria bacterium]|nr:type II secretion system protein [Gammaproteobacteria bacterium]
MRKTTGFTLVEILIVMLIISIVGSVAVLTISRNQNSQYTAFAKQLTNYLALAEQQAILQPATLGIAFTEDSFQFYQYQTNSRDKENAWEPLSDPLLGPHRIPKDIHLTLVIEGKTIPSATSAEHTKPYLIISNSGDIPTFVIYIGKQGAHPRYKIVGEPNGSIKSEPVQEE